MAAHGRGSQLAARTWAHQPTGGSIRAAEPGVCALTGTELTSPIVPFSPLRGAGGEACPPTPGGLAAKHSLVSRPDSYDAAVIKAELLLERSRLAQNAKDLNRALETLEHAGQLDGCQNRVSLLRASTLLERVRQSRTRGESGNHDLDTVFEIRDRATGGGMNIAAWQHIFEEADRLSRGAR